MTPDAPTPRFEGKETLVPAVVQDSRDGRVLMLAYMNAEAYEKTQATGHVHFWSRSRQQLWMKGESSGNRLRLESMHLDCDRDTILVRARPEGPVCHTGSSTCFADVPPTELTMLAELEGVIRSRSREKTPGSYTAELLAGGPPAVARKVTEEATEVLLAAIGESTRRLAEESADLIYHLLVLLESRGIGWHAVCAELQARRG